MLWKFKQIKQYVKIKFRYKLIDASHILFIKIPKKIYHKIPLLYLCFLDISGDSELEQVCEYEPNQIRLFNNVFLLVSLITI